MRCCGAGPPDESKALCQVLPIYESSDGTRLATVYLMATMTSPTAGAQREVAHASSNHPSRAAETARSLARTLLVSVVMAGLGYVGGRIHARYEVSGAETALAQQTDEQRRALESALAERRDEVETARVAARDARAERARMADLVTIYEGYRMSQHALGALDSRNFGIAQSHLRNAEVMLRPLEERVSGVPQVVEQVAATDVAVAENLSQQRSDVIAVVSRLDRLLANERGTLGMGELAPVGLVRTRTLEHTADAPAE